MTAQPKPFDRSLLKKRFQRAQEHYSDFAFLEHAMVDRAVDRLADVTRSFGTTVCFGARTPRLKEQVAASPRVSRVISMSTDRGSQTDLVADEEGLPFAEQSLDLVVAAGGLHWVNDLPGAFIQLRRALKPDGLFLASFLGGDTLTELRQCLMTAEEELEGGVSLRVSPFVEVRDAGSLLQRAGFALPVADVETLTVTYASAFDLLKDLRGMGETNALSQRRRTPLRRGTLLRAMDLYHQRHATQSGRVTATFDILNLTGWAPAPSQPRALRPGSATARLADALDTTESELDDPAPGR